MKLYSETEYLYPIPPFDFAKSLDFFGLFIPTEDEQTLISQSLTKAILVQGQTIGFQIKSLGTVEEPRLECQLFSEQPILPSIKTATLNHISFFLSLSDNLNDFYRIGQNDLYFAPIIKQLYGYHQVKFLTPFETACWAVLTQRTPLAVAKKMKQALIEKLGGYVNFHKTLYYAFPEPAAFSAISKDELVALVKNKQKAEYLIAVAKAFSGVDENFLKTGNYSEVESWLRNIQGIGTWSASFILIRGLGRTEFVPLNEKKFLEVASKVYAQGQTLTSKALGDIVEKYGQWQGYWAHYLRVAG